jgi:hypothetical protein
MTYKATFAKKLSCRIAGGLLVALMAASTLTYAQTAEVNSVVPNVVNYNGTLTDASGKPLTGISGVTFSLYKDSEAGAPLWMETQNLQPDSRGHFSAKLGSASGHGLPADLFASGEARWLGVRPQGQEEQPRVLLLSVPYALKALDAETLGGKPASAFLTAPSANSGVSTPATNVTGSGTKDFIPMWTGKTKLGNSKVFQSTSGQIGIGTTAPGSMLDVRGDGNFSGTLDAASAAINGNIGASGNISAAQGITATGGVTGLQGVFGNSTASENAVVGINNGAGFSATAGVNHDSGHLSYGVSGQSFSQFGAGVLGYGVNFSNTYKALAGLEPFGVVGDAQDVSGVIPVGVWGTADAGAGVVGENNSTVEPAGVFVNLNTGLAFEAEGKKGNCTIDTSGDLSCTGTGGAVVSLPDNRWVSLYSVESPGNWFEDFGSGTLANGAAVVNLEPTFAQTVNTKTEYHVFITPNGESEGLYVVNKTAGGFEVHEQHGGHSNIGFDYRIVGRRLGYENVRMEDVTAAYANIVAAHQQLLKTGLSKSVHLPTQDSKK